MDYEERVALCKRIAKLGGRKKGGKNKETLKREAVRAEYKQLVLQDARRLFFSQSVLAHGQQFLFRIDKIRIGKDRYQNSDPILVTDRIEIESYLTGLIHAGDHEDVYDPAAAYYFITTKEPNGATIADMLDRGLGKERQVLGLEGSTPGSAIVVDLNGDQYDRLVREEFNRIGISSAPAGTTGEPVPVERTAEAQPDSEAGGE